MARQGRGFDPRTDHHNFFLHVVHSQTTYSIFFLAMVPETSCLGLQDLVGGGETLDLGIGLIQIWLVGC
jgi:hypothetical protein